MRLERQSNRQVITLDTSSPLGSGGEARVYAVARDAALAAKIYHQPTPAHARKLAAMLANRPDDLMASGGHDFVAWPVDVLRACDGSGRFVGFLMPRVGALRLVIDLYNPGRRRVSVPLFNSLYLHRTARNLAAAVRALHARGYVIGDINESNILVAHSAQVTLVDADSFQVPEPRGGAVFRCPVGKPEMTPPELQGKSFRALDRAPEHDHFGLAVLIFQLLMEGAHPFAGAFLGPDDPPPSLAERIKAGHFAHGARCGPCRPLPGAVPFEVLHPALRDLFTRCFQDGHGDPQARPDAAAWQSALDEAENALATCAANSQHRYGSHLSDCPWCRRKQQLKGRDPFPSEEEVRQKKHLNAAPPVPTPRATTRARTATASAKPSAATTAAAPQPQPPSSSPPISFRELATTFSALAVLALCGVAFWTPAPLRWWVLLAAGICACLCWCLDQAGGLGETLWLFALLGGVSWCALGAVPCYLLHGFYSGRGESYHEQQQYRDAVAAYTRAIRLDPGHSDYKARGDAYLAMERYDLAIADYDRSLRDGVQSPNSYHSRGVARHRRGELDAAISDYSRAIALDSQDASTYSNRGSAYLSRGQAGRAISDYTKALSLAPGHAPDLNNRACAYRAQKQFEQALSDHATAIGLEPGNADFYIERGLTFHEMRDNAMAVADFTKALSLEPRNAGALVRRGNAHAAQASYTSAIADYNRAISIKPNDAYAYNARGHALARSGQPGRAIADFSKALALDSKFHEAYANRGDAYVEKKRYKLAIQDFSVALRLRPNDSGLYGSRARAYHNDGQHDLAVADYGRAVSLDGKDALSYFNRGLIRYDRKQFAVALQDFSKAASLEPRDAQFREWCDYAVAKLPPAPKTVMKASQSILGIPGIRNTLGGSLLSKHRRFHSGERVLKQATP